jgi:chemotaxis protein MotA
MNAIIGIVVLMVCVFGGFIMAGGSMKPIIKAAPVETFIILGAGIGGMLIGNSMDIFKGALGRHGQSVQGALLIKKEDYLSTIFVVSKIMKTLKTEGPVALEAHIENPESSAIFGEYPKILHDHASTRFGLQYGTFDGCVYKPFKPLCG